VLDAVVELAVDPEELISRLLKRAETEDRAGRHRIGDPQAAGAVRRAEPGRCWTSTPRAGLLRKVDGMGEIDEVTERLLHALETPAR
jgi:adenylate kinase